jgi:hypothetical protein
MRRRVARFKHVGQLSATDSAARDRQSRLTVELAQ